MKSARAVAAPAARARPAVALIKCCLIVLSSRAVPLARGVWFVV
jgi:hypothetical protein